MHFYNNTSGRKWLASSLITFCKNFPPSLSKQTVGGRKAIPVRGVSEENRPTL